MSLYHVLGSVARNSTMRSTRNPSRRRSALLAALCLAGLASPAMGDAVDVQGALPCDANTAVNGLFNPLTVNPRIRETSAGEWGVGTTITLSPPAGFEFDVTQQASVTIIVGDTLAFLSNMVFPSNVTGDIVFEVNAAGTAVLSVVEFSDIFLRPLNCASADASVDPADITVTVAGSGVLNNTPLVDVTLVPGAVDEFIIALTPTNGIELVGNPILVTVTGEDLCDNPVLNAALGSNITITALGAGTRSFATGMASNFTITDANPNDNTAMILAAGNAFDANGEGTFSVNSATADGPIPLMLDDGTATGMATVEWIDIACTLMPATDTNQVGEMHTVTADVTRNGAAVADGTPITFEVTAGPNTGQMLATTTTGGQASFMYTSNGTPGTDSIEATTTIDGQTTTCMATKEWIDLACTLDPLTDTNQIGTMHTVTADVTRNGVAVPNGTAVMFEVTAGPNTGEMLATVTTGGQASFTYTDTGGPGTDTIEATATLNGVMTTCTATKEWINLACTLGPPTDINAIGAMHTVTASVTRNGVAVPDGTVVDFDVTAGPNTGAMGSAMTALGQADFMYTSNGTAGTDTIEATVMVDGVTSTCTAMKEWIDPTCSLDPPAAVNMINTMHTVTVEVLRAPGVPAAGVMVDFDVVGVGPNAGDSGSDVTNAAGMATFMYPGDGGTGVDMIEATGMVDGVPFLCTATKEWIDSGCGLMPLVDTNQVGTDHTVTVVVVENGAPVNGETVNFDVTAGPNNGAAGIAMTDANGEATFTYTGAGGPGTDTIEASGMVSGVPFLCTATKTWIDLACTLNPPAAVAGVGETHMVTANVTQNGVAVPDGTMVNFTVTAGPNVGAMGSAMTALGQAGFMYTSNGIAGTDTIEASFTIDGVTSTCTAMIEWVNVQCSIAPPTDVNPVGAMHTVTVTVLRNGVPVGNQMVDFDVIAGPNAGDMGSVMTDPVLGEAMFTYTGDGGVGTDTIRASGMTIDGIAFECTASKEWVTSGCALIPDAPAAPVGGMNGVTVTVLRNGAPVAGVDVTFDVINGPNFGVMGGPTATDALGEATFAYTGAGGPGVDTVEATGMLDGVPFSCQALLEWVEAECEIAPLTDTNLVGTAHTVTATVRRNGVLVQNVNVTFNVIAGPNSGLASAPMPTDANGEASFTYNSNGVSGTDTIRASGTIDGDPFQCDAMKEWIDPVCDLAPPSDVNGVGTQHMVTVTVLRDGRTEHRRRHCGRHQRCGGGLVHLHRQRRPRHGHGSGQRQHCRHQFPLHRR